MGEDTVLQLFWKEAEKSNKMMPLVKKKLEYSGAWLKLLLDEKMKVDLKKELKHLLDDFCRSDQLATTLSDDIGLITVIKITDKTVNLF